MKMSKSQKETVKIGNVVLLTGMERTPARHGCTTLTTTMMRLLTEATVNNVCLGLS